MIRTPCCNVPAYHVHANMADPALEGQLLCGKCNKLVTDLTVNAAVELVAKQFTEWRFCIPCRKRFKIEPRMYGSIICPRCESEDTMPVEPDTPRQEPLFTVPSPPSPNAWVIEWRWKPLPRPNSTQCSRWSRPPEGYHPEPPNDWQR